MIQSESNAHRLARASHLINALLLAVYLYTSLGDAPGYRLVVQAAAFPALVFTGVMTWLLPHLRGRINLAAVRFSAK
jgi:hypothetical protein